MALEPQLGDLDDVTLMLLLNSYRIAAHPSARPLAAAALPLARARVARLRPAQLAQAARVYAPLEPGGARFAVVGGGGAGGGVAGGGWGGGGGGEAEAHSGGGGGGDGLEGVEKLLAAVDAAAVARLPEFEPAGGRAPPAPACALCRGGLQAQPLCWASSSPPASPDPPACTHPFTQPLCPHTELQALVRHLRGRASNKLKAAAAAAASSQAERPRPPPAPPQAAGRAV